MTKQELILILKDLKKVRNLLTPQQAEQVPHLFPKIKENTEIKQGNRYNFDGEVFEALEDIKETKDRDPRQNNQKWSKPTRKGGR